MRQDTFHRNWPDLNLDNFIGRRDFRFRDSMAM